MLKGIGILAGVVLLSIAGYVVWGHFSKEKTDPLDPFRREVARMVVTQISEDMPSEDGVELVVFPPLSGDRSGEVTEMVRQSFNDTGKYNVIDHALVLNHLEDKELKKSDLYKPSLAAQVAQALDADGTMSGKILSFPKPSGDKKTSLTVKMTLRDKSGSLRFERRYRAEIKPSFFSLSYQRANLATMGGWRRFLVWAFIVLMMPILLHPLLQKLLTEESNLINLYMLLGMTAVGALAAYVAIGLRIEGFWEGFAFLLACITSAFWNYVAATFVEVYLK